MQVQLDALMRKIVAKSSVVRCWGRGIAALWCSGDPDR